MLISARCGNCERPVAVVAVLDDDYQLCARCLGPDLEPRAAAPTSITPPRPKAPRG